MNTLFSITPNYEYTSQSEECRKEISEKDFIEICDFVYSRKLKNLHSMNCPQCGKTLVSYAKGKNKCVECQKWFNNPNIKEINTIKEILRTRTIK